MAEAKDTAPRQIRKGGCHCGAFAYELEAPEIKSATECNCSICDRKGYLFVFVKPDDRFTVVKGSVDALTSYTFGAGKMEHKFCPACGTGVFVSMPSGPPGMQIGLNVHSIEDIDSWSLERHQYDGAAAGTPYEPPAHKGSLPETQDGEQIYTGSCHCGDVTIAVASKPLDETYEGKVTECNCSSCERNANVWFYPFKGQAVLAGDPEARAGYSFSYRVGDKTFCRRCGVSMTNEMRRLGEDELAQAPENLRGFFAGAHRINPVNLRVLHGVDRSKLKVGKAEGREYPVKPEEQEAAA